MFIYMCAYLYLYLYSDVYAYIYVLILCAQSVNRILVLFLSLIDQHEIGNELLGDCNDVGA